MVKRKILINLELLLHEVSVEFPGTKEFINPKLQPVTKYLRLTPVFM